MAPSSPPAALHPVPSRSSSIAKSITSAVSRIPRPESDNGAFRIALDALATVGQATQTVPYLSLVSGLLAQVVQIKNEVDACKEEWEEVMEDIDRIREMIDRLRERFEQTGRADAGLPRDLKDVFLSLDGCINSVLETLSAFRTGPGGLRGRLMVVLQREKRLRMVQQCRREVARVLQLFNSELQIHQLVKIEKILTAVQPHAPLLAKLESSYPDDKLPAPPAILCGRSHEVDVIVDMILHRTPAHVAIIGPGGIGKTSVALAVLHSPAVVEYFENRRYFVACDAATSADSLVLEILKVFGMTAESGASPTTKVLAFLQMYTCVLCLDNFETPWDADPRAVEAALAKITATANTTLLLTTRGSSRPLQTNWTKPLLPALKPLTVDAALEAWESISGARDEYAEKLVEAVDCVPLAVTLLAHLAEADCAEVVWMLWNKKFTAMVHTHDAEHRLSSVEFSIELSLQNPRIAANPYALRVLSVLCMLPLGMRLVSVDDIEEAFKGALPEVLSSRLVLMQTSLAYSTDGFLRVLSPIRHYVQKRHPPEDILLDHLEHYYLSLASQPAWRTSLHVRQTIYIELGNIASVFEFSLERSSCLPALVEGVLVFSDVCTMLCVYDIKLLTAAAVVVAKRGVPLEGRCLGRLGFIFYFLDRLEDAADALKRSIAIHTTANDRKAQANDLRVLARLHIRQNRMKEAEDELQLSAALYVEENDDPGRAQSLWVLGTLYRRENRIAEAMRSLEHALALSDSWSRPDILLDIGHVNTQTGNLPEAERVLLQAVSLHAQAENQLGRAHDTQQLGFVYTKMGRLTEAQAKFEEALELHDKTGSQRGQAFDYRGLANIHLRLSRPGDAEDAFKQALDLHRKAGERPAQAEILRDLAQLYADASRWPEAEKALQEALDIRQSLGDIAGEAHELRRLGELYKSVGRPGDAKAMLTRARDIYAGTDKEAYDAVLLTIFRLDKRSKNPFLR